jgi:sortase (surface protein transpeptidase)
MSDPGRHTGRAVAVMRRRSTTAVVIAAVCTVIGIGVGSLAYATNDRGGPQAPAASDSSGHGHQSAVPARHPERATTRGPLMARSVPVRVDIPSVGIDTSLLRLGLNRDGTLQVPWKPLLAGWYQGSPTPGELGPSIIAGHVDSWATGPAVFYHLGQVAVGAHVLVRRADGSVADFQVTAVTAYPKASFPTHVVYGDVDRAELRLITCAQWNSGTQEYDDDVVVFARLVRAQA